MPRAVQSPNVAALIYFQTAPLGEAEATFEIVKHVLRGRKELEGGGKVAAPRKERSDKGQPKRRPEAGELPPLSSSARE